MSAPVLPDSIVGRVADRVAALLSDLPVSPDRGHATATATWRAGDQLVSLSMSITRDDDDDE